MTLGAYLGSLLAIALACEAGARAEFRVGAALALSIALMHFWYDGFIWSVRRHEVDPQSP